MTVIQRIEHELYERYEFTSMKPKAVILGQSDFFALKMELAELSRKKVTSIIGPLTVNVSGASLKVFVASSPSFRGIVLADEDMV